MSFIQWAKNFLWGINDTMNLPAVAIWELWAFFSPRWSKAEYYFKDFANSARNTSDMWQDRGSVGYVLGRAAPGLAVYWALPAAWALPALGFAWVETAGLSTLWSFFDGDIARAYNWQQNGNGIYANQPHWSAPTSLTWRRITPAMAPVLPQAPAIVRTEVPQPDKYLYADWKIQAKIVEPPVYKYSVGMPTSRQQAKRLVTNELKRMNAAWELMKNISRTQKLIDLYKKLK